MKPPSGRTVYTGARLIDGTGAAPVDDAYVVVDGTTITAVGTGPAPVEAGSAVFDATGLTLMPGMIDAHVHLLANASSKRTDVHLWNVLTAVEEQTIHAAANARLALMAGVTTVRDMAGSQPEVAAKHALDDFVLEGARVLVSGFVGMTAGHGDMFCPATVERRLWKTADGPDECRKLVREYARMGVDFIKLCTSGGVLSVGDKTEWRNFTTEEIAAIVDEAHALGKRVGCHAHSNRGITAALDACVDTIEHGTQLDDSQIDKMLAQGTYLCPTLSLSEFIDESGAERGVPAASLEKARKMRPQRLETMRKAYQAGVPVIMGTDSCNTLPFGSHAWELDLMNRHLGMPAMECIVASTSRVATALGIDDITGSIVTGKRADLLLVAGDPLADVAILRNPANLIGVARDGMFTSLAARDPRWSDQPR